MCKSIDFSEQYVIVAPDAAKTPIHLVPYAYGPTISVEIKVSGKAAYDKIVISLVYAFLALLVVFTIAQMLTDRLSV